MLDYPSVLSGSQTLILHGISHVLDSFPFSKQYSREGCGEQILPQELHLIREELHPTPSWMKSIKEKGEKLVGT